MLKKILRGKKLWVWGLAVLLVVAVGVGLRNDAWLYGNPVAQVTTVQSGKGETQTDSAGNKDTHIHQVVHARLLNGTRAGKIVQFTNDYTYSGGLDFKLAKGNQVFLTEQKGTFTLNDIKRDVTVGVLLAITVMMICLLAGKHALVTICSIILNTVVFFVGINLELTSKGNGPWYIVCGLAVLFTLLTVAFIIGFRPVAVCIALSTLLATTLAVGLGYGIMQMTGFSGVHLEQVKYVTQNPHLIFFAQIVIGSLGAVLDETSDISVSIFQLPADAKTRFKAGMSIGRSVMGPLIAVLFMIFMADTFTESILWLRNGNTIAYTVSWVMGLGFVQSIISAFGIVLAVPLTSGLAAVLAGGKKVAA